MEVLQKSKSPDFKKWENPIFKLQIFNPDRLLEIEFEMQGIPFDPQRVFNLEYKGRPLDEWFKPDFICFDQVIVEIKAVRELADEHRAQLLNYLKATGLKVGLLVNFGHHPGLQWERLVL